MIRLARLSIRKRLGIACVVFLATCVLALVLNPVMVSVAASQGVKWATQDAMENPGPIGNIDLVFAGLALDFGLCAIIMGATIIILDLPTSLIVAFMVLVEPAVIGIVLLWQSLRA